MSTLALLYKETPVCLSTVPKLVAFETYHIKALLSYFGNSSGSGSIVTRLQAGVTGILFLAGAKGLFLFITVSKPALGPTQPPVQWVFGKVAGM
jgi:hypothetical protein